MTDRPKNWPPKGVILPVTYRDFIVDINLFDELIWHHVSYDGTEDNRCGYGDTMDSCYKAIDSFLDD